MKKIILFSLLAFLASSCSHKSRNVVKNEDKSKLYLKLAVDQLKRKEYQASLETTFKAIELVQESYEAYNHLALIYLETKRYSESEKAFKKALTLKSDYPEAMNNLGVLYNKTKRYSEAINYFQQALRSPKYVTPQNALTNMGYAYLRQGDVVRAKKYHRKALDVAPDYCLAHKNLGDSFAKDRNYNKAAHSYESSLTYCPLYQEAHYKYGLALAKVGKVKIARTQLESLVQRYKKGVFVEKSHEVLKRLY